MSSCPPHLKNLLRQVNINPNADRVDMEIKVKERAVQQLNHYLRVVNTRLSIQDQSEYSHTQRVQTLLAFIHQHIT
jgi:hypothetical protein